MKKIPVILIVLLAVVNIGLAIYVYGVFTPPQQQMPEENLRIVPAPEQSELFTVEVEEIDFEEVIPEGVNVAQGSRTACGGYNDVYYDVRAVDGKTGGPSYWEGKAEQWPNWFSVTFDDTYPIYCLKVCLNPAQIWGKRVQEFSVEVSTDGENFTELLENQAYQFDPMTGNYVLLEFDEVEIQAVKLVFQSNSGAIGPQMAELEAYTLVND